MQFQNSTVTHRCPLLIRSIKRVYFLVAADLFERFKALLNDEDFDIRETYAAQSEVAGKAGWDDHEMDVYDDIVILPGRSDEVSTW